MTITCEKLASELGSIVNLADHRRPSLLCSERTPCRAKLITRFDDRYAEAKLYKSGVWDKVLEEVESSESDRVIAA